MAVRSRLPSIHNVDWRTGIDGLGLGLRGCARDLIRKEVALHHRGGTLSTTMFLLPPLSFLFLDYSIIHAAFPVVLSTSVFLCSLSSLGRTKLKATSTRTYATMLQ